jgi:hypothetical protein
MPLKEDNEFVLIIDSMRSISCIPTADGRTAIMFMEDPHSQVTVEITKNELIELIEGLSQIRDLECPS